MSGPNPLDEIRLICNVGHGEERRYVRRFQQAIDAVIALCEPYDQPRTPAYSNTRGGSEYGRGFADGLRAKSGAVLAELIRALLDDDKANGGAA